jgi:hypothetical protein
MHDIPDRTASRTPAETGPRAVFFEQDGEAYLPKEACRSPWNPGATNGIAVAGLLMHAAEQVEAPGVMLPAHLTIDILRPVPFAPTLAQSAVTRAGKNLQMVETHLMAGETPVARARLLRVREAPCPSLDAPMTWPAPEDAPREPFLPPGLPLADLIETRLVAGEADAEGPGTVWTRLNADLVPGVATSPVVHAAMLSDFGNGLSRAVDPRTWSFANVDISLHMVRRPVGEWLLADARSMLQGVGVGLTDMTLCDRLGPFARAHQTLFVAARG